MPEFVHLHNHTHYSLLDGACSVDGLVNAAVDNNMSSVALTDHGVLFGLMEFYKKAKKEGVKPILGCELYVANGSRFDRGVVAEGGRRAKHYTHLIILAKNDIGYRNLVKLSTIGHTEGFYYKPRVDLETLRLYREGLIALSACAGGVIAHPLLSRGYDAARDQAIVYKEIFGDDFYLELQNHHIDREQEVLEGLPRIAKELGIKLVCTNDCHYVKQSQAVAHNVLLLIKDVSAGDQVDVHNLRYQTDEVYFRTAPEMHKLFKQFPEAIQNSVAIAEQCNVTLSKAHQMPRFPIPGEAGDVTLEEYLRRLTWGGIEKRFPKMTKDIEDRAQFELGVIEKMGYAGYFLIVQDFIAAARSRGISVGPGRGSAAGSLVAYALGITNVDPIRYNLLFERFLNPERVSMPDIDIDFADDRRAEVIQYVKEKYGHDSVSQIITFNTMSSRAVLKDVGRVLGLSIATIESITKNIPVEQGKVAPLRQALEMQELRWVRDSDDPKIKQLVEYALVLEGFARNASTHAAGVVITPGPVDEYVPLYKTPSTDLMTQYNMKDVEEAGLLKMDFLGLSTLTIIDRTLGMIKERHGIAIDIDQIPVDDEATYKLFGDALTVGVFQFESSGMQEHLKKLKPSNIEDLTAMNALYRPGPMQHIDEFIDCKNGTREIVYLHPLLEPILKETYGVIVVQEQVMRIARDLGGFSLAKADEMRRAMGKKDKGKMGAMRDEFIHGCAERGVERQIAEELFARLAKFAEYAFNKSHSLAYSYVAYQTAYLKAHYPAEFFAANLSASMSEQARVVILIDECKRMGVSVLPPDVNESNVTFSVTDAGIRFGLAAIKNVGETAVQSVLLARKMATRFRSFYEFCKYVDTRVVNRKTLESLIQAGAFDTIEANRATIFESVERGLQYAASSQSDRITGQSNLFDLGGDHVAQISEPALVPSEPWGELKQLALEKQVLGFYVSGHPLRKFEDEVGAVATVHWGDDAGLARHGGIGRVAGVVSGIRKRFDKRERPIAFVEIEDFTGKGECIFWSEAYAKHERHLIPDNPIVVVGKIDNNGETVKIVADEVYTMQQARDRFVKGVLLSLRSIDITPEYIASLKTLIEKHKGEVQCYLSVYDGGEARRFQMQSLKVSASHDSIDALRRVLGKGNVRLV
jgi:DNA polymerase-3 subunit alpha